MPVFSRAERARSASQDAAAGCNSCAPGADTRPYCGMTRRASRAPRSTTVTDALRSDIVAGVFAQGQRLTEDHLGERYGVSRIPVREALRGLEAEGFVTIEPYCGAQVAQLSAEDAIDLLDARQALEEITARRAAARRPWDAIEQMAGVLAEGRRSLAENRFDDLTNLNTKLHSLLVSAGGNHTLVTFYDQLRTKAQWVYSVGLDDRAAQSWREHEDLVAAVAAGDSHRAGDLAREHLSRASGHYIRYVAAQARDDDTGAASAGHSFPQ